MVIANVTVHASSAVTVSCEPLPVGGSGLKVRFTFAEPAWKHLSKTVVFRNSKTARNAILTDNCATIPHELLTGVLDNLSVGIYGTDSSRSMIIPTVWAELGKISASANPAADYSTAPTVPYWAQVKESVDRLQESAMDREDLENALNEAKASGAFDGPPGRPGEKGEPGIPGINGTTPVRGIDYWTDADKAEIHSYIEETILGGAW